MNTGGFNMANSVYNRKLLFIEDDRLLSEEYEKYFSGKMNTVKRVSTLAQAEEILSEEAFDAVILDLMLPDGDGIELFEWGIRLPPVIILSTLSEEPKMLEGFQAGAVDYIVKPCSPTLLEMRLSLRLIPKSSATVYLSGITLNTVERSANYYGTPLPLTGSEFNILYFLMKHPDTFFDSSEIYRRVWEAPSLHTTTIRYHISNLRRKIKELTHTNLIVTEFGKGYAFVTKE